MVFWRPLNVSDIPIGGFRGLDESVPATARQLGVLSSVSNLVLDPVPSLSTRPGLTAQGSPIAAAVSRGIHQYRNLSGSVTQTLAQAGTQLSYWNGSAWANITASAPDKNFTGANLNDLGCLFYSGSAPKKWDGATLGTLGGSPPQGEFVCESHEQLFVCGIPGRMGDVDGCDVADPEVWSPSSSNDAFSITVTTSPTRWIAKDQTRDKVLVWSTQEMSAIIGPETSDRPALWQVRVFSPYGTVSGRSVQCVKDVWIWLTNSSTGVGFAMWAGGSTQVVYDEIKTSLGLIDWSNAPTQTCSWLDEFGRYHCKVPKTSGYEEFLYDPKTGAWSVGASKDTRASGTITVSGKDYSLVGNEVGQMYRATGTDDGGSAISYSVEIGPSPLADGFSNNSQVTQVFLLLSAAAGATINAAVACNESGSYGTTKSVTAGTSFTRVKFPVPVAAGDVRKGSVFRLKVWGTGVVTIHDVLFTVYQGSR